MSKIGFYRYKFENATTQEITLYVNGTPTYTHNVVAKSVCTGYKQLKFLDRNGQYRFYPFAAEHEISDKPDEIGQVTKFIAGLLSDTSASASAGYTNERTVTLRAKSVSADELEILSDIYTSPRVFLYVGDGTTDDMTDWVQVTVTGDNVVKRAKKNFGLVEIKVLLPEYYTITA